MKIKKGKAIAVIAAGIGILLLMRRTNGEPPPPPPPPPDPEMPTTPPFGIVETALGYSAIVGLSSRYNSELTDRMTVGVYSTGPTIPRTISVIIKPNGTIDHVDSGGSIQNRERQDHSFSANKTSDAGTWAVFVYAFNDTAVTSGNFYLGKSGQFLGSATEDVS